MRSSRRLGTFRRNSVRKCLGSRLYTIRNSGTVRSQCHPKCHPASGARRRTISRIAVANSPHFGFGRRTYGLQRLFGIFYRFERPQTQKALAYFGRRLFQRFGTSRFVECVGSRQRTFAGLGGSFVLCVFGSRDFESQSSVSESSTKFCHSHIVSKVTADCLIVEVPGHLKLSFFSFVLTSLNLPMLKLYPLR